MSKKSRKISESDTTPTKKIKTVAQEKSSTIVKNCNEITLGKKFKKDKNIDGTSKISDSGNETSLKSSGMKSFEKPNKPSNRKPIEKTKLLKNKRPAPNFGTKPGAPAEKPENWSDFKKKKKELKVKRKQGREGFGVLVQAKSLVDKIQRKSLNPTERNKLVNQLHGLLKGHNSKFALAHDSSRLVQCALKYGSTIMRGEISKEVMGIVVEMMTSKYGKYIVQRMLKHGEPEIRRQVIDAMYGNAVKFSSHVISSPILEYAYSTWATPQQKCHLLQEFFSDMYKNSKDNNVRHLKDVYESSPDLKSAVLGAVKDNLSRILNKNLFDSGLVQTLLCQYLSECSAENRADMITQIGPHVVVISNSKDGSRAAMQCIWHGTNKDRKVAMKALKEHVVELSKHEHGHCAVITLLDTADDTVLLHKIIVGELLKHARELAVDEWGRKVLLWLVAPANPQYFHPIFIKELESGRSSATSKKPSEIRQKELLQYASGPLLDLVKNEPEFWLSKPSLAIEMLGFVKAGTGQNLGETHKSIVQVITDPNWTIKENDEDVSGIEHAGIHMTLKKLAQHDKIRTENNEATFGLCLAENLTEDVIKCWIGCNRGCFLLVAVFENSSEEVQDILKAKLQSQLKKLKKESSTGAKILLKKLS